MTTINSHSLPLDVVAQVLAESLPYIKRFHGKTIVVKYGGNAMTEEVLQRSFAHDVVLLKLFGLNPVVVHGGGKAVGLTGKDGSMIQAVKKLMPNKEDPSLPIDIGYVGDIAKIEPALVKALQDDQFIPVISPIGYGEDGLAYNINADVVAGKMAEILGAEKLLMMTNITGVLDKNGSLLRVLSAKTIDALFEDGTISGGMLPKISSAVDAARNGVKSVHIVDGRVPHCLLLEILTDRGVGTMITSD